MLTLNMLLKLIYIGKQNVYSKLIEVRYNLTSVSWEQKHKSSDDE